jgi:hypothetical protein
MAMKTNDYMTAHFGPNGPAQRLIRRWIVPIRVVDGRSASIDELRKRRAPW